MKTFFSNSLVLLITLCSLQMGISQNNFFDFDGVDDYAEMNGVATQLSTGMDFTFETWIRTTGTTVGNEMILCIYTSSGANSAADHLLRVWNIGGNIKANVSFNTIVSSSGLNFSDGDWHHLAVVISNGKTITYYGDGINLGGGDLSSDPIFDNAARVSLAQEYDGVNTPSGFIDAQFDEVRFWSVARTQAEIQADMNNSLSGSITGLIAAYDFNQGSCGDTNSGLNTLIDNSSSGFDGTLFNTSLSGCTSNWVCSGSPCNYPDNGVQPSITVAALPSLSQYGLILLGITLLSMGLITLGKFDL